MATSLIPGMSDAQWTALMGTTQSAQNDLANGGKIQPVTPVPTPSKGSTGAGATTGLPSATVPIPTVAGGSGGGGWMGVAGAQNMGTSALPGAAAGAQTGVASTGTPAQVAPTLPQAPQQATNPMATVPYASNWSTTPQQAQQSAAEQAAIRIKQILAGGKNSYDTGIQSATNARDYTNTINTDNRSLRNASLKESANPFGGQFGYQAAQNNRNDSISDTATNADYNNRINSISQTWQDLQTAAPEQQQALYDQLYQQAAALGIQADQLNLQAAGQNAQYTGQYNGQQTMQAQQQAYNQSPNNPANQGQVLNNQNQTIQNQLAQYQLDNYPAEAKAKATLLDQQVKSGQLSQEAAQYNLDQLKDPNSPSNQAAKLDLQMKQIDASTYSQENKLKLQQLQKQIADIGVVHKTPQTADEIAMDKVKLQTAQEQLKQLQNTSTTPKIDPKESTDNLTFYQSQIDSRTNLTKAQQMAYAQNQKSGLSASDYDNLIAYINKLHAND